MAKVGAVHVGVVRLPLGVDTVFGGRGGRGKYGNECWSRHH